MPPSVTATPGLALYRPWAARFTPVTRDTDVVRRFLRLPLILVAAITIPLVSIAAPIQASGASQSGILSPPPCTKHATVLRAGSRVPAADLASIAFLSPSVGVGVTLSSVNCLVHRANATEPYPVRLAITKTSGITWNVEGSALPKTIRLFTGPGPSLAFTTLTEGWVAGSGTLARTSDGGRHWKMTSLGSPVVAVRRSGVQLLALTGEDPSRVWHTSLGGTSWHPGSLLPFSAHQAESAFALGPAPGWVAVAATRATTSGIMSALAVTSDAGSSWSAVGSPCSSSPWNGTAAVAIAVPRELAIVCGGLGGAGSEPKGVYVSHDAGANWTPEAQLPALNLPDQGGLPYQDTAGISAPAASEFWLTTPNEVSVSRDDGQSWSNVPNVNLGGGGAVFSFLGPLDGWMLAPGTGLWRTTDGRTWTVVGS